MWKFDNILTILLGVLLTVNHSSQRSNVDSPDYVAAVVEYSPYTNSVGGNATEVFYKNVDNYVQLIIDATKDDDLVADIIVFPEAGLSSLGKLYLTKVPLPFDKIIPCTDTSGQYDSLKKLSCAARDNAIYVVVNLSEMYLCPNGSLSDYNEACPETGILRYNTNVALDRSGAVVARYRKHHLFGEYPIVATPVADLVTFDTDFGVKFGLFTCFDLMFDKPAIQLVEETGTTDFIFPTAWFSELPFLTAVQAQAAWSYSMDVNFLTSGYNQPAGGSAGSGIYAGREGPLQYVMPSKDSTHLLINRIAKKNLTGVKQIPSEGQQSRSSMTYNENRVEDGIFMKADDLSAYETYLLDSTTPREVQLCHGQFCCDFDIVGNMSADHSYGERYFNRLVAFNGVRTFTGVATGGVQICAVVSCADENQSTCGHVLDSSYNAVATGFQYIRIRAPFMRNSAAQFPNTLIMGYGIIPNEDYTFTQVFNNDIAHCDMILNRETSLLTFAIFGRVFTRDGDDVTLPSSGSSNIVSVVSIFIFSIIFGLINLISV